MVARWRLRLRRPEAARPRELPPRVRTPARAPTGRRRWWGLLAPVLPLLALPAYWYVQGLGYVEARGIVQGRLVAVGTHIRGILAAVTVSVGDRVEPGAELARLDTGPLEARLARARARAVEAAARLRFEEAEWRRVRRLVGAGVESVAALQRARERREAAAAALAAAKAEVQEVEALLRQVVIRAPVRGIVIRPPLPPGSVVDEDTDVAVLLAAGTLWVDAYVPESERARLRPGQPAEVEVEGFPGQVLAGQVAEIYREVRFRPRGLRTYDTPAETYQPVRITLRDPGLLTAEGSYGMRAVVRIRIRD